MKVRVPATSANLGPGFDCLGIALNMYNEVEFEISDQSLLEDANYSGDLEDNLIYMSYRKVFEELGQPVIPVLIRVTADIPPARGLGSSSACIIAGIVGAFAMMNMEMDEDKILYLANKIEGHPDNVAPCIKGGLVVSVLDDDKPVAIQFPIKNSYKFLALIPDFKLSTKEAREVLPAEISLKDGVFNSSRLAMLLASLVRGEDSRLALGLQDRLHQLYRGNLIPGFSEIMEFVKSSDSLGAYLSGAGPTIMVLLREDDVTTEDRIKNFLPNGWEMRVLSVDKKGFQIID